MLIEISCGIVRYILVNVGDFNSFVNLLVTTN